MNATQTQATKPNQQPTPVKPLAEKPKKIQAYTPDELRRSIERKQKRKLELQGQIQKLDAKILERQTRLQELTKKLN